ncbi:MAG: ribosome recycling factor, partial [candidate division NC10 bacterium]|nr:ribosome recycling factor [candidate division NC10 bacterium]
MQEIIRKAEQDMKRATEATLKDFNSVRTGRASLTLLDGIQVDYHGTL